MKKENQNKIANAIRNYSLREAELEEKQDNNYELRERGKKRILLKLKEIESYFAPYFDEKSDNYIGSLGEKRIRIYCNFQDADFAYERHTEYDDRFVKIYIANSKISPQKDSYHSAYFNIQGNLKALTFVITKMLGMRTSINQPIKVKEITVDQVDYDYLETEIVELIEAYCQRD